MATVLMLADDGFVGTVLRTCLAEAGHGVLSADDPGQLVSEARSGTTQAVVLAVPEIDSTAQLLCRRLAAVSAAPVLVVVDQRTDNASAEATLLRAGADDVVRAPFYPDVLLARLEVLLRRRVLERHENMSRPLIHDGIVVDLAGRRVWVGEIEVTLTRVEFNILAALIAAPQRVHSRLELAHAGRLRNVEGCLDPHLSRLRRKIRDAGGPRVAIAVHGSGFRLTAAGATSRATTSRTLEQRTSARTQAAEVGG